jgi:hypothetical protein
MVRDGGGPEVRAAEGTCALREAFVAAVVGITVLAGAFPARSETTTPVCAFPE